MLAALGDLAVFDNEDLVRRQDRGEPVGDEYTGPRRYQRIDGVLDLALGDRVKSRRRLVEDQQRGIPQQHARYGKPLLLTAGQLQATVADHRIKTVRLIRDKVVDIGPLTRVDKLCFRSIGLDIEQVLPDRSVEQVCVLGHDADIAAQEGQIKLFDIDPVEEHLAAYRVVEARNQVYKCTLARTRRTYDCDAAAGIKLESHVFKDLSGRLVVEIHVLELNASLCVIRSDRIRSVLNLHRHVKIFKDPREHSHGAHPVDLNVEKGVHRPVHPSKESHQHRYITDRKI